MNQGFRLVENLLVRLGLCRIWLEIRGVGMDHLASPLQVPFYSLAEDV